jgi:hypothetical protein
VVKNFTSNNQGKIMQDNFADGIGNISASNGLVRIEFASQRMPAKEGEPMRAELTQRLVMPLAGFLAGLSMQEQVRAQLIKDGTIKLAPPVAENSSGAPN